MEKLKVQLIDHTSNPVRTIFAAIRTCYSPYSANQILTDEYNKYKEKAHPTYGDDVIRLLAQIADHQHMSTFEHASFTFALTNVSRNLLAQLTRHRIGWSYSVQSQRYVKQSTDSKHGVAGHIVPPTIANNEMADDIFSAATKAAQSYYDELVGLGIKAEDARYVLPGAATTNIIVTCNLRSFMDLYKKRNHTTHTQWEFANLAEMMKEAIVAKFPELSHFIKV